MRSIASGMMALVGASAVSAAIGALGCTVAPYHTEEQKRSQRVELYTYWVDRTEREAIQKVIDYMKSDSPPVVHVMEDDLTFDGSLLDRFVQKRPPDLFLVAPGAKLRQWVQGSGNYLMRLPVGVTNVNQEIENRMRVGSDGSLYAFPIGVHRLNLLIYSTKFIDDVQAYFGANENNNNNDCQVLNPQLWQSPDDLFVAAKCIDQWAQCQPGRPTAFAIGAKDKWTLTLLVWENMFLARGGKEAFENYFAGKGCAASVQEALRQALCDLDCFLRYANGDLDELDWGQGIERVKNGQAAMTIHGDWARPLLNGEDAGQTFAFSATPGTSQYFVANVDALSVPEDAPNKAYAVEFLSRMNDGAMTVFNKAKGSIPPLDTTGMPKEFVSRAFPEATMLYEHSELEAVINLGNVLDFDKEAEDALGTFVKFRNSNYPIGNLYKDIRVAYQRHLQDKGASELCSMELGKSYVDCPSCEHVSCSEAGPSADAAGSDR